MILKKNRNQSYLSTYKKHNLVSYHESEKTIINSSNWLEELTFIGQNTTPNIDYENRVVTAYTNVRATNLNFKLSQSNLNTDVEIEGHLRGGRNPSFMCGTTSFPLLTDPDGHFKIRFYCPSNTVTFVIVDGQMHGVDSTLTLQRVTIYESPKNDEELKIKNTNSLTVNGLDLILPTNVSIPLSISSTEGSTQSMQFYSRNESLVTFDGKRIITSSNSGTVRTFVRNKYGLGKIVDLEIIEDLNVNFSSERRFLRVNETLPLSIDVTPYYFKDDVEIQGLNRNAEVSLHSITGKEVGDVEVVIQVINDRIQEQRSLYFKVVDDGTLYNNVERLKQQNLSIGDTYTTDGYYEDGDGGAATYTIMTYEDFLASLPNDIQTVNFGVSTQPTPVDEYGNHTLANGLVAKITHSEGEVVKVEQWGCVGDGKFNNTEALIHLFAHTKTWTIQFGNGKNYVLYGRNKNIAYFRPDLYLSETDRSKYKNCKKHQYVDGMCPHITSGSHRGKPILANIQNVILDGNGCTITIPPNEFALGTCEFGIFDFSGDIDGLEIKGFEFRQNGLQQNYYLDDNGYRKDQPTRAHTLFFGDNCSHKWNNVNIHHNKFYECGTNVNISDSGGDFILVVNPLESQNVFIEDNEFYDWGRWVYSVDLGGNGERFYNYKFNRNTCIQTDHNRHWNTKTGQKLSYRGLGWIDFEARKCFTNLECCDNYVYGLTGWAINGNGKMTNNVVVKNNEFIRDSSRPYRSAYPYNFEWYSAHIKDAIIENNNGIYGRFGASCTNITFLNNDGGGLNLYNCYGDIVIDNSITSDTTYFSGLGTVPSYEGMDVDYCNIVIRNSVIAPNLIMNDPLNPTKFDKYNLVLENNILKSLRGSIIDVTGKNIELDIDQLDTGGEPVYGFIQKADSIGFSNSVNFIFPPRMILNEGAIITNGLSKVGRREQYYDDLRYEDFSGYKALRCTKAGSLIAYNHTWLPFEPNKSYKQRQFLFTDENIYLCGNNGVIGDVKPTHTSGAETLGTLVLQYYAPIAQFEKLSEFETTYISDYKVNGVLSSKVSKEITKDLGESFSYTISPYPNRYNCKNDSKMVVNDPENISQYKVGYMGAHEFNPLKEGAFTFEYLSDISQASTGTFTVTVNAHQGEYEEIKNGLIFNVNRDSQIQDGIVLNNIENDLDLKLMTENVSKDSNGSFVLSGEGSYLKFSNHFLREMLKNKQVLYFEICCDIESTEGITNLLVDDPLVSNANNYLKVSPKDKKIHVEGNNLQSSTTPILAKNQLFAFNWWGDTWAAAVSHGIQRGNSSVNFHIPDEMTDLYIGLNANIVIHEIKIFARNITANDLKREFFALYNKY